MTVVNIPSDAQYLYSDVSALKVVDGVWHFWTYVRYIDSSEWAWREADQGRCEKLYENGILKEV